LNYWVSSKRIVRRPFFVQFLFLGRRDFVYTVVSRYSITYAYYFCLLTTATNNKIPVIFGIRTFLRWKFYALGWKDLKKASKIPPELGFQLFNILGLWTGATWKNCNIWSIFISLRTALMVQPFPYEYEIVIIVFGVEGWRLLSLNIAHAVYLSLPTG